METNRIKKAIAILLAVLFLVSVTAAAVSACPPLIKEKTKSAVLEYNVPVVISIISVLTSPTISKPSFEIGWKIR